MITTVNENEPITIGCVGMTHLGLIHAVAFAAKGLNLICYDQDPQLVKRLQTHELPINEPQLNELVHSCSTRLEFTHDLHALSRCAVVFIAYDVPTDDDGNSDFNIIDILIAEVAPQLSDSVCLVLLSQVSPGYTRLVKFAKHRLFYQVETLIFGRAVERALYPERYIIGAHDPHLALPTAYWQLLSSFHCPILKMHYESAELTKISINMFLVSAVTTTNTIAEICENIGADWAEIAPALKLDKRIGQHAYLTPGLGLAGGNLERDLQTIIKLGQLNATDLSVVKAWLNNSKYRRDWVWRCLQTQVLPQLHKPLIAILGLAHKPNTHSVKNSPSLALIHQLKNYQIRVHDPVVEGHFLTNVRQYKDSITTIEGVDVVIVMTPWPEYQNLSLEIVKRSMHGNTIIDPYRVLKKESAIDNISQLNLNYFTLGERSIQTKKKESAYA